MKIKHSLSLIIAAALTLTGCSSNEPAVILPPDETVVSTPYGETEATEITEITGNVTVSVTSAVSDTEQSASSESGENSDTEGEAASTPPSDSSNDNPGGGNDNSGSGNGNSGSGNGNSGSGNGNSGGGNGNSGGGNGNSGGGSDNSPGNSGGSFEAGWINGNTWESGGKYCGTIELKITNKTGTALSGWTVSFTVPSGFEIANGWNGIFSVSGTTVTAKNESYNGDLANGASVTIGFQYSSPTPFDLPSSITINGNSTGGNGGSGGGSSGGNTPPANTTSPEPTKPLPAPAENGLVKEHGKLSVKGAQLVDKNGKNFQLKGMSTHGIAWFPDFINENAFKTLRDDWNTNVVRLAMYTAEYGGYCSGGDKTNLKNLIDKGVQAATKLGMYVIIDWHILSDSNPQTNKAEAKVFFEEMSSKYRNYDNVLYEICNEPNGSTSWSTIKSYAEEIIPIIRKNSPDSVVIVGTPTWSQDIDQAESNRLKEKNVMYALHFYAATHTDWLRQRVKDCYNKGLPIFVTEFGCCDASGNGANDFNQTKQWLSLLDSCGISYCNWNLANKNESSSAFKESASANGSWSESDMSESGKWIRKWFRGEIS